MPDDTIEARARRAAEEIVRNDGGCTICDYPNLCAAIGRGKERKKRIEECITENITAIIVREMGEEFDKIKRDRDCMTAIHMCLENNEAVSRVLNGCYYTKEAAE